MTIGHAVVFDTPERSVAGINKGIILYATERLCLILLLQEGEDYRTSFFLC